MALAKTHQSVIEAELDREIKAELSARAEKMQSRSKQRDQKQRQPIQEKSNLRFERSKILINHIWDALLGALITISHRLEKIFNKLVKKGRRLRKKMQIAKQKREAVLKTTVEKNTVSSVKLTAVDKIHHLEESIENSLDRGRNNTLHWIGVPSQEDFNAINNQLKLLSEKVEFLEQELQQAYYRLSKEKVNRTLTD